MFLAPIARAVRGRVVDDQEICRRQQVDDLCQQRRQVGSLVVGGQADQDGFLIHVRRPFTR